MRKSAFFWLFLFVTTTAFAVIYDVPGDFATIQAALNASASGDSVLVGWGIYHENLVWPEVDGISLVGLDRDKCIVDGSSNGRVLGFLGNWQNPVITYATKVRNLTLRNGGGVEYGIANGLGVNCYYASPEIYNCVISDNVVPPNGMGSGAGVYCYNSSPHFTDLIIVRNTAYSGGGVHLDPLSSPVFVNCVIADNTLMSPGGSYAAGIYTRYQVYPQFSGCTITRNRYMGNAAIHLGEVSNPTFTNCTITDNEVGFRLVSDATMNTTQCTIMDNTTGIANPGSGTPIVTNNFWGDSSGPQHSTNPTGTGDTIEGAALFTPWLNAQNPIAPPPPPTNLTVTVNGTMVHLTWTPIPGGVDYYEINYGADAESVFLPSTLTSTAAEIDIQIITAFAANYFQVKGVRANGISSWYSEAVMVEVGVANDDQILTPAPQIIGISPNPFALSAMISYRMKTPGSVSLKVYNLKGQLVRSYPAVQKSSGEHHLAWDGLDGQGRKVPAGVYLVRLTCEGSQSTAKAMLIR